MEAGLTGIPDFGKIAWHAPWLEDWRALGDEVAGAGWREALDAKARQLGLTNARGLPLRFVAQQDLPGDVAYEAFIDETGGVPTRANLHDFFNALVWLRYPEIKRGLNAIQARELAEGGVERTRGKVRDMATLFDENAALFACADAAVARALRARDWDALFIRSRASFGVSCGAYLFGHALLDKLTAPFKAITAHAWVVEVDVGFFQMPRAQQRGLLDAIVARQLLAGMSDASFTPLPVLGVPGWAAGQDEAYYRDQNVFRPKRIKTYLEC